jgi:hypothetical protein
MRTFFKLPVGLFLMALAAGCENTVQVEDGGGGPGGGSGGQPPCEDEDCCLALPSCASYEVEVATCDGSTALSCRAETLCGSTIFCEEYETCTAVPVCDGGDTEVPACPNDGSPCYQVELCGGVISCVDNGLAHGCPAVPPTDFEPCVDLGLVCDYPLNNGCYDSWSCQDPFVDGDGAPPPDGDFDGAGGSGAQEPVQPYEWHSQGTFCDEPAPG